MKLIVRFLSVHHLNVVSNNETAMLCLAAYIFIRHIANLPFDKEPIEFFNSLHKITNWRIINNNSMEFCYHQSWYSTFSSETKRNFYNFYILRLCIEWLIAFKLLWCVIWCQCKQRAFISVMNVRWDFGHNLYTILISTLVGRVSFMSAHSDVSGFHGQTISKSSIVQRELSRT